LNIHEYQAKEIFKNFDIPVHSGSIASTPEEAYKIAKEIFEPGVMFAVKAQAHAGGRGKGGGIKIVKSPEEVQEAATAILGKQLVTPQTGPEGKPVDHVLVESTTLIKKEYYASVVLDRSAAQPCLIVSEAGGMEIEEVAAECPDKIIKKYFSAETGLNEKEVRQIAGRMIEDPEKANIFAQGTWAVNFTAFLRLLSELGSSASGSNAPKADTRVLNTPIG